jgi:hypothetical protein
MARLINLNLKGGLNVITQGNPESKWPHVLKTASSNSAPVIDLDFSKTPQIDSRLTFARSTTATVMAYAATAVAGDLPRVTVCAINEARFQNARRISEGVWSNVLNDGSAIPLPITLLAEEARTNLATQSESFSTWTTTGTGITDNNAIAPSGATTACLMTLTATTNLHRIYKLLATVTGINTISLWVKKGTASFFSISDGSTGDGFMKFDANTGLIVQTGGGQYVSSSVIASMAGGYRISLSLNITGSHYINIALGDTQAHVTDGNSTWLAAGTETGYIWGLQIELAPNASSYIPTAAAAVTRTVDAASFTGTQSVTNLCLQSQTFGTTWTLSNANIGINAAATTSPDGTTNAYKIIESDIVQAQRYLSQTISVSSVDYTVSCYFKKAERNWAVIQLVGGANNTYQSFNLDSGVLGTLSGNLSRATITDVGLGWYRCTITATLAATASLVFRAWCSNADSVAAYSGATNSGIYIYGAQLEAASTAGAYVPTTTAAVTAYTAPPTWYNAQQGTFAINASGQYSSAPGNIGVWNPLLTGSGSYAITYNKNVDNSAYLYLPNAQAGVNPVEYQDIPTPTTILLCEQGILNLSKFTYYPKAIKANKVMSLVSGTLTTAFDTSYAAVTTLSSAFLDFPYAARTKYFPKINSSAVTTFRNAWNGNTALTKFPLIDISKSTNLEYVWLGTGLTTFPAITIGPNVKFGSTWQSSALTSFPAISFNTANNCNSIFYSCTALTTFPAHCFDIAKATIYTNAFYNCALTQASVDNILVSIAQSVVNTPTLTGGTLNMTGGTNAAPSATGLAAKAALVAASWTVTHN